MYQTLLQQEVKNVRRHDEEREQKQKWKRLQRKQIKAGGRAWFPKKRDLKIESAVRKFEEMKKNGGVDKFIAKKRRKHAQRDRKKLPRMNY